MGLIITILGTIIAAALTWMLPNVLYRLGVTAAAAYAMACAAYMLPHLFSSNDQASSWQWIVINGYFKIGAAFGLLVIGVIQIVKMLGHRYHDH